MSFTTKYATALVQRAAVIFGDTANVIAASVDSVYARGPDAVNTRPLFQIESEQAMNVVSHQATDFSTGLVPILPIRPKPLTDDELAAQVEILRRRQLRRDDVRKLLLRRAERKGVTR